MKRKLVLLTLICLLVAALAVSVSAEEIQEGNWKYTVAEGQATITQYLGTEENVVIPNTLGGYPVGVIANTAFSNHTYIRTVTIPACVNRIEDGWIDLQPYPYVPYGAFAGCSNLTTVTMPSDSKLSYIGEWAFYDCANLSNITIPGSVRTLALSCFEDCTGLTEVVIPEGVETVCQNAFSGSGVKNLHIPSTCTEFHVWNTMPMLESITVAEGNYRYRSHEGVLYDYTPPFSSDVGWTLVQYPISKSGSEYRVPDFCEYIYGENFDTSYHVKNLKRLYLGNAKGSRGYDADDSLNRIPVDLIPGETNPYYLSVNGMLLSKDGKMLIQVPHSIQEKVVIPASVTELAGYLFYENYNLNSVYFEGDAPIMHDNTFGAVSYTAYYPQNNSTWTEEYLSSHTQFWNGSLTWVGYGPKLEGLNFVNGVWGYYEDGVLQTDYTGLVQYNGAWFYVRSGLVDWNYMGLTLFGGIWFYVDGGTVDWDYVGLTQYNGGWFYIDGGMVNWDYAGMMQHGGYWYYIEDGRVNWNYSSLTQYNGYWFYIGNGMVNWDYNSLAQYNGYWFYIDHGMVDWNYAGLAPFNGMLFYVRGGMVDWNYNGTVVYGGVAYQVVGGIALPPAQPAVVSFTQKDHSVYRNATNNKIELIYSLATVSGCDANAAEKINAFLLSEYQAYLQEITGMEEYLEYMWEGDTYIFTETGSVSYNDGKVLSLYYMMDWWMGGVFNSIPHGYTFDLTTGQQPSLDVLYGYDGNQLLSLIKTEIRAYLNDNGLYGTAMDQKSQDRTINGYTLDGFDYYVSETGELIICIPVYELAAGAAGSLEIPCGIYLNH